MKKMRIVNMGTAVMTCKKRKVPRRKLRGATMRGCGALVDVMVVKASALLKRRSE
jgi:uncharacterized protein YqjF (DUF2071 family)